uniref:ATP synthase F0 subunit 6 n=1 Tax=Haltichella nipponensis TaxID=2907788 RepID=UPI001EDDB39A|nr:ATP synthase F0 subunit 6 [Haltichella nipponensis]UIB40560.1 ATP synthase F0 subunit 6 [Haltichella nipponensis]
MMNNLFTIFDPSTSNLFSLKWLSMIYIFMFIPLSYWFIPSRNLFMLNLILNFLFFEFKSLLNFKIMIFNIFMFLSIFMQILLNNLLGMFPYIFVATSHMSISLSFSFSLWMSFMIFGWMFYSNHMFSHLVPQSTPKILMPFMVIIESVSNYIRFSTLAIRLSANMIAGHLLMTLISSSSKNLSMIMLLLMIFSQMILVSLELAVAMIQAYVFSILSLLYMNEVK